MATGQNHQIGISSFVGKFQFCLKRTGLFRFFPTRFHLGHFLCAGNPVDAVQLGNIASGRPLR